MRDRFFLKKERTFFFGVLPSKYSGSVAGRNADEVLRKLFFGERILQGFGSFVFEFGSRKWKGFGEEFSICSAFCFGEILGGQKSFYFDLIFFLKIKPKTAASKIMIHHIHE
ncbi:hypothetical protein HY839_00755, partial [Candidatus Azambacteria bacterium]|nr:hypothetical protein [Candidatus Azambacteria bacterium]